MAVLVAELWVGFAVLVLWIELLGGREGDICIEREGEGVTLFMLLLLLLEEGEGREVREGLHAAMLLDGCWVCVGDAREVRERLSVLLVVGDTRERLLVLVVSGDTREVSAGVGDGPDRPGAVLRDMWEVREEVEVAVALGDRVGMGPGVLRETGGETLETLNAGEVTLEVREKLAGVLLLVSGGVALEARERLDGVVELVTRGVTREEVMERLDGMVELVCGGETREVRERLLALAIGGETREVRERSTGLLLLVTAREVRDMLAVLLLLVAGGTVGELKANAESAR